MRRQRHLALPDLALSRRALLASGGAALLAGCGDGYETAPETGSTAGPTERLSYGDAADQYGILHRPEGRSRGTLVMIHGGYWLEEFKLDLMPPLAESLQARGFTVWNIEYRRLGTGGGFPETFEDVAAAVDFLADVDGVETAQGVYPIGHSAGGTLAVWAASRTERTPGGAPRFPTLGALSLGGVLALADGSQQGVGGGVIDRLMGGTPATAPEAYALGDPVSLVTPDLTVDVVVAAEDGVVPPRQADVYSAALDAVGGTASRLTLPGMHGSMITPDWAGWDVLTPLVARRVRRTAPQG